MHARFAAFLILCSISLHAAVIRGKVVAVDGGEPLARVQVLILETGAEAVSVADGSFEILDISPGAYTLRFNAVGYRLVTVPFTLAADEQKEFDVTLAPDNFRRTEKVEVKGDIFQGPDSPAVIETNLSSSELREASTVIADDPLRSVQALPSVSAAANNDFDARISVAGAPFEDISIYLDGILVPEPFHGAGNFGQGATLSIVTSNVIDSLRLFPVAYPEKYGDSVGAALDLRTREGSRARPTFRASAGLADSDFLGEGALGHENRGSWLASARKSYLGFLLRNRLHNTFTDISFYDADLKLAYDLTRNHSVTFYAVGGHTSAELIHPGPNLRINNFKSGTNDFVMARGGWRWTVNPRLQIDSRLAYVGSPFQVSNLASQTLQNVHYHEWIAGTSVVWGMRPNHVVEGDWTSRRMARGQVLISYNDEGTVQSRFSGTGNGWRNTGTVQEMSSFFGNRLHVVGSLRLDTATLVDVHPGGAQAAASLRVAPATEVQFGVGRYTQFDFPPFPLTIDFTGLSACAPQEEYLKTANQYSAGIERRLGEGKRLRASFIDRENQRYLAHVNCPSTSLSAHFQSVGKDYSRGLELVFQSRTASRVSGWIGYTFVFARQNAWFLLPAEPGNVGRFLSPYYPTLQDQRHTLNAFASYRITPTVHLSAKLLLGSGFPRPSGEVLPDGKGGVQFIGLNSERIGPYQRLDIRSEKDWAFKRWKLALYGEVLNLTNHDNQRFVSFGPPDPVTGWTGYQIEQGLPITPTAAIALEF